MRKGVTLVELLLAVSILLMVGAISVELFGTIVRDIPDRKRAIDEHTALAGMVRQMRKDASAATDASAEEGTGGLVLTCPAGKVRYQAAAGRVERTEEPADAGGRGRTMAWPVPHATVRWDVRRDGGRAVGLEVRTKVDPVGRARDQRPLANAHVLLLGAAGREGDKP
ncbi:MAG TPA: prepilin-type N-terminal cleavage/methylation domain-containing protein [Phycisphaerae bacterium]|nr:prepilin-type N-terminal cleavage/methylation domain-containing protein [Phycisphaerae bacterium]HUU21279.1 prepilin-type N-terminal cleavage/methylation domain-containing protein [Phycisphaerae bacterium]